MGVKNTQLQKPCAQRKLQRARKQADIICVRQFCLIIWNPFIWLYLKKSRVKKKSWALKDLKMYFLNQLLTLSDGNTHEHNAFCQISHERCLYFWVFFPSLLFSLVWSGRVSVRKRWCHILPRWPVSIKSDQTPPHTLLMKQTSWLLSFKFTEISKCFFVYCFLGHEYLCWWEILRCEAKFSGTLSCDVCAQPTVWVFAVRLCFLFEIDMFNLFNELNWLLKLTALTSTHVLRP